MAFKLGVLGANIAAAITDGCSSEPSICKDRDAIEKIEKEIDEKKKEYDREYVKSATEWVALREANTDNAYIAFYINETMRKVETLSSLEDDITKALESRIPELFRMYQISQNFTSEEYLQAYVERLEYSLSDLKDMLKESQKYQLIGLAAQFVVEATISTFMSSYKKAFNQLELGGNKGTLGKSFFSALFSADEADAKIMLDPDHPRHKEILKKHGLKSSKLTKLKNKIKLAPKAFLKMFQNTKKYFLEKGTGIKKWRQIRTWKGFKGKIQHSLKSPIAKLNKVKLFITSPASRKFTIRAYKLSWSKTISISIGALLDGLNAYLSFKQWESVADTFSKARKDYEDYLNNLKDELESIAEEQRNISREWTSVITSFQDMSKAFREIITNVTNNTDFADVMGLPRLPVSPSNVIMTTNFDHLTRNSVIGSQKNVITFLKENDNNLTKIVDRMRARYTLYTSVTNKTASNESVTEILSDLRTGIFNFNPSGTVKDFGNKLTKKDIVCTISILLPDKSNYDKYPLPPFRPRCDVNESSFTTIDQQATQERNMVILNTVVKRELGNNSAVSLKSLLTAVRNVYTVTNDPALLAFGNSITGQDVVCAVATLFPQMTDFDFFSLSPFRPDCSAVSSSEFTAMNQTAARLSTLSNNMISTMNICDDWNFCPCVPKLAEKYNATEADILKAIKRVRPNKTQYCGTRCECVSTP